MIHPPSARQLFERFVAAASAAPQVEAPAVAVNRALVERYFDMWNTGNGSVADAVLGATYLDHAHPEVLGPAALRSLVPRFHAANPDARMTIELAAADSEFVAVRNTISRTVSGQLVESEGVALFRVADGKLVEQWSCYPHAEEPQTPAFAALSSIDAWLSFRA
jgi:predicted SnoaL-like aldol condensation-catalyzing enzyme